MKIKVHKADPVVSARDIENSSISITETLPKFSNLSDDSINLFIKDAAKIYEVIVNHLPQGTRHQLLLLMLEDAKTHYRGV